MADGKNVIAVASVKIVANTTMYVRDLRSIELRTRAFMGSTVLALRSVQSFWHAVSRAAMRYRSVLFFLDRGMFRAWRAGVQMFSGITRWIKMATVATLGFSAALVGLTVSKAFNFEKALLQLAILKGSFKGAKEQFADIREFAAKTPLRFEDIFEASKQFQLFGGNVLNSMENLEKFGAAAAFSNREFSNIALWIGRMYSTLQSGGKQIGKPILELQKAGVLSAGAAAKMRELSKQGKGLAEIWKILDKDMGRFNGALEALSRTGLGLISTMKDRFTESLAVIGEQLAPAVKTVIDTIIQLMVKLKKDGTLVVWGMYIKEALENVIQFTYKFVKWIYQNFDVLYSGLVKAGQNFMDDWDQIWKGVAVAAVFWFGKMFPGVKGAIASVVGVISLYKLGDVIGRFFDIDVVLLHAKKFMEVMKLPFEFVKDLMEQAGNGSIGDIWARSLARTAAAMNGIDEEIQGTVKNSEKTWKRFQEMLSEEFGIDKAGQKMRDLLSSVSGFIAKIKSVEGLDLNFKEFDPTMFDRPQEAVEEMRKDLEKIQFMSTLNVWKEIQKMISGDKTSFAQGAGAAVKGRGGAGEQIAAQLAAGNGGKRGGAGEQIAAELAAGNDGWLASRNRKVATPGLGELIPRRPAIATPFVDMPGLQLNESSIDPSMGPNGFSGSVGGTVVSPESEAGRSGGVPGLGNASRGFDLRVWEAQKATRAKRGAAARIQGAQLDAERIGREKRAALLNSTLPTRARTGPNGEVDPGGPGAAMSALWGGVKGAIDRAHQAVAPVQSAVDKQAAEIEGAWATMGAYVTEVKDTVRANIGPGGSDSIRPMTERTGRELIGVGQAGNSFLRTIAGKSGSVFE